MSGKIVTCVLGLALRQDKKVLLTQRSLPNRPDVHLHWQVPGGGMEFGESPEQTLAREMEEELQCSVRILSPRPLVRSSVWEDSQYYAPYHVVLVAYLVSIGDQVPVVENDPETNDCGWFSLEEVVSLPTLPYTVETVSQALEIAQSEGLFEKAAYVSFSE